MSNKFVVKALALAVAGAFALPALATSTVSKTTAGTQNYTFAKEVLGITAAATDPLANVEGAVAVALAAPEILIGRTNGSGDITVIVTISGAEFNTIPDADGADNDCAVIADNEIFVPVAAGTLNCGSVSAGTNTLQFTITPPAAPGIAAGDLFSFAAGALKFKKATGLSGAGVTASAEIRDTNTNILLSSASALSVLTATDATTTTSASGSATVDVTSPSEKTKFLTGFTYTQLGTVTVGRAVVGGGVASTLGTGAVANDSAGDGTGGDFVFDVNATIDVTTDDEVDLVLTVPNDQGFTAAGSFWVDGNANCASKAGNDVNFVKNVGTGKYEATVGITATTGNTYTLCANANGTSPIIAQTLGLSARIDLQGTKTVDPAAHSNAAFTVWGYNGTVVDVISFNPSSNAAVDSLLRVVNDSGIDGQVTIEGRCQDGTSLTATSFDLQTLKAVQYSSSELQTGTAGAGKPALSAGMGTCASGRIRLTVTGQFPNMEVQNFLRANTSAGVITSGHNNED